MGELLKFDNLGRYKSFKCEECADPILGHLAVKCRGLEGERYDPQTVKSFEEWLERIAEFRQAVDNREKEREDRQAENQANKLGEAMRSILENGGPRGTNNPANQTTQLIKARWPPV